LPVSVQAWLRDGVAAIAAAGRRVRPQFIRRPEVTDEPLQVMVGRPGRLLQFRVPDHDAMTGIDLPGVALDAVSASVTDSASGGASGATRAVEPHYFVCTNGQRDVCCARFGLPVYAALRERVGDRVWQVTHLCGHRFAPNVLVLPQQVLYGRVHPARVDAFVDTVEAGGLAVPELRGRTALPPAAQAAEAFLLLEHAQSDDGRSGNPPRQWQLQAVHAEGEVVVVQFAASGTVVALAVRRDPHGLLVQPSCGAAEERVFGYQRCPLPTPASS
ncbi:MAG: sucrase ferredoxin, partial [Gammaproteobacteria bacterium]